MYIAGLPFQYSEKLLRLQKQTAKLQQAGQGTGSNNDIFRKVGIICVPYVVCKISVCVYVFTPYDLLDPLNTSIGHAMPDAITLVDHYLRWKGQASTYAICKVMS